jgi:hypothetical protein
MMAVAPKDRTASDPRMIINGVMVILNQGVKLLDHLEQAKIRHFRVALIPLAASAGIR